MDWLALVGDSADNIPGVPGVGTVTAAKWLSQYGSLDALIANAAAMTGKIGDKLRAGLAQLPLSRRLATLDCRCHCRSRFDDLRPTPPDAAALRALCERYEFRSWLRDLSSPPSPAEARESFSPPPPQVGEESGVRELLPTYLLVLDQATLDGWLERLRAAELIRLRYRDDQPELSGRPNRWRVIRGDAG